MLEKIMPTLPKTFLRKHSPHTPKERNIVLAGEIHEHYKIPRPVSLKFMNDIGVGAVEEIFYQMKKSGKTKELFLWTLNQDKKKIVWK